MYLEDLNRSCINILLLFPEVGGGGLEQSALRKFALDVDIDE